MRGTVVEQTDERVSIEVGGGVIRFARELVHQVILDDRPDAERTRTTAPQPAAVPTRPESERDRMQRLAQLAGPDGRAEHRGRWTLIHDHPERDRQAVFAVLEATWQRVHYHLHRVGVPLAELRGRCVVVLVGADPGEMRVDARLVTPRITGAGEPVVMTPSPSAEPLTARAEQAHAELTERRGVLTGQLEDRRLGTRERHRIDRELIELDRNLEAAGRELADLRHTTWGRSLSRAAAARLAHARGWLRSDDPEWLRVGLLSFLTVAHLEDPIAEAPVPEFVSETTDPEARLQMLFDDSAFGVAPDRARADAARLVQWLGRSHPKALRALVDAARTRPEEGAEQDEATRLRDTLCAALQLTPPDLASAWSGGGE